MKRLVLILYVIILLFYSCSTKFNLDISELHPQIVVTGFITNDSLIYVSISKTSSMDENNFEKINNAKIKLFENNQFIEELSLKDDGLYVSSDTAKIGIEYSITIFVNGFDTLKSSTLIPTPPILNEGIVFPNSYFDQQQSRYASEVLISFEDNIETENFYQISFYGYEYKGSYWDWNTDTYTITDSTRVNFHGVQYMNSEDPIILNEGDMNFYRDKGNIRSFIFSDELLIKNNTLSIFIGGIIETDAFPNEGVCVLRSINKDFYKFQKSWIRQLFNQGLGDFNPANMFLSKNPNELYSNIENGLGIFAGYSESQIILTVVD